MAENKKIQTDKRRFEGEWVKLENLISKAKVKRCGSAHYPVLSMTMHDGIVEQVNRFKKTIASKDTSSYKIVEPGQLVVGFPIDEGVIYVQGHDFAGIMSPAYNVWDIDRSKIHPAYLELALHSTRSMAYYADKMRGTTARRRSITDGNLLALEIPLPTLQAQNEIVSNLHQVNEIAAASKRRMEVLDDLVKSRFIEMIGDPLTAKTPWKAVPLGESCEIVTGNTPPRADKNNYGDYIEWCKTDNITDDKYLTTATEMLSEVGATKSRIAPEGSILMACIAGSMKSIGKVAVANRRVAFNQQINAVIPGSDLQTDYLLWLLKLSKDYLCSSVNMQLKGILNKSALSAKVFPVPPLALQQEFANFVTQVDKLRFDVQQQIEKLETLKQSLMQEYFG